MVAFCRRIRMSRRGLCSAVREAVQHCCGDHAGIDQPGRYVATVVTLGGNYQAAPITRTFQITK